MPCPDPCTPALNGRSVNPLRVLHVVASINEDTGGPAVSVPALARALAAAGADCTLASLDFTRHGPRPTLGSVREVTRPAGFAARALRGWSPGFARAVGRCARESADIVHGNGLWMFPNLYARRAAVGAGVPLVISPRGMLDAWSLGRSAVKKALAWRAFEQANLNAAALFHATSEAEAVALRALGMRQPIAVIANGVAMPEPGKAQDRGLLELRFPGLRGKRWLLFLSRLHPKKGVSELLDAWKSIEASYPEWHLVLAGPDLDGYGAAMRNRCSALGLAERTTFTGMLSGETKECALANAGLFVLPTHAENFGVAVAEALAHGVPAITTRAAPWPVLQDAKCGWWIHDGIPELEGALGDAMRLDGAELRAMGERGRSAMARNNSWERVGHEMLSAYLWLTNRAPRPGCVST